MTIIFVDCEADGPCIGIGKGLTEFGAVELDTDKDFYGAETPTRSWHTVAHEFNDWLKQFPPPHIFVSDNNGFDWQWINHLLHHQLGYNIFGHSSRRIGDYYAGLCNNFRTPSKNWKRLRITKHDHNPVNDARGNREAFIRIQKGER